MSYPTSPSAIVRHERRRRERTPDPRMTEAKAMYDRWLENERERTKGGRPTMPRMKVGAKAPNNRADA